MSQAYCPSTVKRREDEKRKGKERGEEEKNNKKKETPWPFLLRVPERAARVSGMRQRRKFQKEAKKQKETNANSYAGKIRKLFVFVSREKKGGGRGWEKRSITYSRVRLGNITSARSHSISCCFSPVYRAKHDTLSESLGSKTGRGACPPAPFTTLRGKFFSTRCEDIHAPR